MRVVVAITGRAGSGKTTLANKLVDRLAGFSLWSFATKLKAEVAGVLGISLLELAETKGSPATRRLLQALGAARRAQDGLYFIRPVLAAITSSPSERHVIDDVRFPNELAALRTLGHLITVRTVLLGAPVNLAGDDESETALDYHPVTLRLEAFLGDWEKFDATVQKILDMLNTAPVASNPVKGGFDETPTSSPR